MGAGLLRQNVEPEQRKVYLIGECGNPQDLVDDFAKYGFEIAGWFQPEALREWKNGGELLGTIEELEPEALAVRIAAWKTIVLDLRDSEAFRRAHIPEALNLSLKNFKSSVVGLPHESTLTVVCETGEPSSFVASLLWKMNYRNLAILRGGFRRYREAGLRVVRPGATPG
jgi:rhodanese-related sulfurtransferase